MLILDTKISWIFNNFRLCGGKVVSVLAFFPYDLSSNPAEIYSNYSSKLFKKDKNEWKEACDGQFMKYFVDFNRNNCKRSLRLRRRQPTTTTKTTNKHFHSSLFKRVSIKKIAPLWRQVSRDVDFLKLRSHTREKGKTL